MASPGATSPDERYTTGVLVRRLIRLAANFPGDLVLSFSLNISLLLLGLAGLQLLGQVIDVIRQALDPTLPAPAWPRFWHPPADWAPLQTVTALSLALGAQALLRASLTYAYNMTTARLTQGKIVPDLRSRLYARLQHLSFSFFDRHGSHSIFNRVTGDAQNTRLFVDGVLLQGSETLLTLTAYAIFMWRIHPALTAACLSVAIPLVFVTRYYSERLRPGYLKNRELQDNLVLLLGESVRGMQTVKGFAAEPHQVRRFEEGNKAVVTQQRRIFRDLSFFAPGTQMLSQISLVVLFAYGGWLHVHGRVALGGGLVVFAGLLQQFTGQVANLSTIANSIQQSLAAARRVFEVLDTDPEVRNRPGATVPPRLKGSLVFENVAFGYGSGPTVLDGISFKAEPGQVVGLFGLTGAGKSSLLSLIPRLYDPRQGRILADGVDLRDLDLDAYRRQVGIVYQETFLFSNTVAANIAFGHPSATMEQIRAAARQASADDFIAALPNGYHTVLGESGVDLSGGQRQRIALARALLLQPPILILDDPTASVDARTENEIVSALRDAMTGRTAFVVSSRLSLLRRADVILVLENGKLTQTGTHEQLAHRPGPYRETALLQMMDLGGPEGRVA
jgi:ATP-binding cassette subfamily B protein